MCHYKITMVGAGRLATNLGRALNEAGHTIVQVYSRTMEAAREAANVMGGQPTNRLDRLQGEADIYILSLKDSALEGVIGQLCPREGHALFVHTAGSVPMDVFAGHARRYGVLYPMQTFSKERRADFGSIPCFVEGCNEEATATIEALARTVNPRVTRLSSADRKHLHLAAVFASNFVNHCYALAADVASRHGIAFETLLPLIDETARKVHSLPPLKAQTGPAVRYDENIIDAQKALLADRPSIQQIYSLMSESIHAFSEE